MPKAAMSLQIDKFTKYDKPGSMPYEMVVDKLNAIMHFDKVFHVSAKTGKGIQGLKEFLLSRSSQIPLVPFCPTYRGPLSVLFY